ncbi:MAG: TonB family protein [Acidobacteriaceae bacterium]
MRILAAVLVVALSGTYSIAKSQDSAATKAAALASVGGEAVQVIESQYVADGTALVPKTGKPLSGGKWAVGKQAPKDCPPAAETCVSVFYTVVDAEVRCEWTVMLIGDGSDGRVLEENEDAARYMIVRMNQSDAAALIETRAAAVDPPIARAAHMVGDVVLRVVVGPDGVPVQAVAVSGPQMLRGAAIDAGKRWRFKPYMVGDRAVPFQMEMTFKFRAAGLSNNAPVTMTP